MPGNDPVCLKEVHLVRHSGAAEPHRALNSAARLVLGKLPTLSPITSSMLRLGTHATLFLLRAAF